MTAAGHPWLGRVLHDSLALCHHLFMIALLRGALLEKHPNQAIVDAGGVGYDVTIPVSTFTEMPDAPRGSAAGDFHPRPGGCAGALRISDAGREGALREADLGERDRADAGDQDSFRPGGRRSDSFDPPRRVEKLVKVPGVGKKTAERMVLELRDKLPATGSDEPGTPQAEALSPIDQDVLSALLNLGCARPQAEAAVRKAKTGGGVARVRAALPAGFGVGEVGGVDRRHKAIVCPTGSW